jgi:hypothetical protein
LSERLFFKSVKFIPQLFLKNFLKCAVLLTARALSVFSVGNNSDEGMTVAILAHGQRKMSIEKGAKKQGYRYS